MCVCVCVCVHACEHKRVLARVSVYNYCSEPCMKDIVKSCMQIKHNYTLYFAR